jgi:hypothetical protein
MANLKQCAGPCGETKPATPEFFQLHTSGYLEKVCKACKAEAKRVRRGGNKDSDLEGNYTDWAFYLRRDQLGTRFRNTSITVARFNWDMLRAVMRLQEYTCPISAAQLVIPPRHRKGDPKFPGWEQWRKTLDLEQQQRTPVLVRVDYAKGWDQGNLVFIAHMWEALYERAGGLDLCRHMCGQSALLIGGRQQEFTIPSRTVIDNTVWDMRSTRNSRAARNEREEE